MISVTTRQTQSMDQLPRDILCYLPSFMSLSSLLSWSLTCHKLHNLLPKHVYVIFQVWSETIPDDDEPRCFTDVDKMLVDVCIGRIDATAIIDANIKQHTNELHFVQKQCWMVKVPLSKAINADKWAYLYDPHILPDNRITGYHDYGPSLEWDRYYVVESRNGILEDDDYRAFSNLNYHIGFLDCSYVPIIRSLWEQMRSMALMMTKIYTHVDVDNNKCERHDMVAFVYDEKKHFIYMANEYTPKLFEYIQGKGVCVELTVPTRHDNEMVYCLFGKYADLIV